MQTKIKDIKQAFSRGGALFTIAVLLLSQVAIFSVIYAEKALSAPGDGKMLLLWDGGTAPSGWTCVSCTSGDPFYQVFPRGADTYGGTGGTATHTHTGSSSVAPTTTTASQTKSGTVMNDITHSHTSSLTITPESNLPQFRQLNIIRSDTAGQPSQIPAGAIGMFDTTLPSGWGSYSSQNTYYIYGENTAGTTGGSNTHSHTLSGNLNASTGLVYGTANGSQQPSTPAAHTHTYSGSTAAQNQEPPYIEVILGKLSLASSPPDGLIAMWDNDIPSNWTKQSGTTGQFYNKFLKGSGSFGATGGGTSHAHTDTNITSAAEGQTAVNSKTGTVTASSAHTHQVTVSSMSNVSNVPPYRDVIIGKKVPQSAHDQIAYRFFSNTNSTDVGAPLAALNTVANTPSTGTPFRLRALAHISAANLAAGNENYKLQYAARSGTCDTSFSGETYNDVSTSSGAIRYYDNSNPNDGANLTTNTNDPTHSTDSVIGQTYEESNNFTSTANTNIGQDAMWDFSLVDFSAAASTSYCFRIIQSDGSPLDSYTVIPEILTDDGAGHMIVFYDGASAPSGWTCVSCAVTDPYYQKFIKGAPAAGNTGGATTHTHTSSASIGASADNPIETQGGTGISIGTHTHTETHSIVGDSNIPPYRNLLILRANNSGVPTTLPTGAIALFDNTVPTGWTRYSAQDGLYIRGDATAGGTGGALTHTHALTATLSNSSGGTSARTNATALTALENHTHSASGTSQPGNSEPPYRSMVLGKLNAATSVPQNIITYWDNPPPVSWTNMSTVGQPLYQAFSKPSATYGTTGGSSTHTHTDSVITSDAPTETGSFRTGTGTAGGAHTHSITFTGFSTVSNEPPYIEAVAAKQGALNTPPNNPATLKQIRTSNSTDIATGGYSNGGQVKFEAQATDTDNPDSLQLCIEVKQVGTAFSNIATQCGASTNYSGSAVTVDVTISGLIDAADYHWQAAIKDSGGALSSWVSYGANAESAIDFTDDSTAPGGSVYDGTTPANDVDFNGGALDELSANWAITDTGSGVDHFEYSIGTTLGNDDVSTWSAPTMSTSQTVSSLTLGTNEIYYFNVRAFDVAGNNVVVSSDGQFISPTISFGISDPVLNFSNLNAGNGYSDTKNVVLSTSTNARNGYEVRAQTPQVLTANSDTIGMFSAGTYATPAAWTGSDYGYGYTSNDTNVDGVNRFLPLACLGGGLPPCYAPFTLTGPGDIVADTPGPITGTPIDNEQYTITHRVAAQPGTLAGTYQTTIIYSATVKY